MKEFKGTKGEWSLLHLANINSGCGAVATVHYSTDSESRDGLSPSLEEAKANARLIAAAPDLLAALQSIVFLHLREASTTPPAIIEWIGAIEIAQSALTKAFGE